MIFIAILDESYYIQKLIQIQKHCWQQNLNKEATLPYLLHYLNLRYFYKEKYPFIYQLKQHLNAIFYSIPFDESSYTYLLKTLHLRKELSPDD